MTAIAVLAALPRPTLAGPNGGQVVAGSASISQAGNTTNINQSSNKAIINWQGFSIGKQETVNFNQPNTSSMTLNRVIGNEASVINGALNANGKVFIVNSAGVLFGKGSQVNVGGLVASTLDISNADFMAGNFKFSGNSSASVVNRGRIRAGEGGYVALLGKTVANDGVISARLGTVAMSSGEKMTLNFGGDSLVDVTIDRGTLNALVENKRAIRADGGRVIMTARAADELLSAQVNNKGIVQARTVAALTGGSNATARKGNITIHAYGGKANIAGRLDASAAKGGDGGFIETSGDKVQIADSAVITTKSAFGKSGTWLIDPTDFTIAASGGDMTGSTLSAMLANNAAVIIEAATMGSSGVNGDIHVNDAVSWSTDSTLTLTAVRDININAPITIGGANARLVMNFGRDYNIRTKASYSGTVLDANGKPVAQTDPHDLANGGDGVYGSITFTNSANTNGLTINGQTYTLIHNMRQLDTLDWIDGVTGLYYNPVTGAYDTSVTPLVAVKVSHKDTSCDNGFCFNPATGLNDMPQTTEVNGTTYFYNYDTNAYDLTGAYSGNIKAYYYNQVTNKYDIPGYRQTTQTYYDPSTGQYGLSAAFSGDNNYFLNLVTNKYDILDYDPASGKYYDPVAQAYTSNSAVSQQNLFFNPTTGSYDWALRAPLSVGGFFALAQDLNASGTTYTRALLGLTDVSSIPNINYTFGGTLAGLGHMVSNLTVNAPTQRYAGLIAVSAAGTTLRDIGFVNANITASGTVGTLLGRGLGNTTISNVYATGSVKATAFAANGTTVTPSNGLNAGGLVGQLQGSNNSVTDAFTDVSVVGFASTGGLIGNASNAIINRAHATGNITLARASGNVGGLVGAVTNSTVGYTYATGDVAGAGNDHGGLLGTITGGSLSNSFARGNIDAGTTSSQNTGGLVGQVVGATAITNVYATIGSVKGYENVGGLIGSIAGAGTVRDAYAAGNVTGSGSVGGFVGANGSSGTITNAYATGAVILREATSGGGSGGGFVGSNSGTISNANAYGSVTHTFVNVDATNSGTVGGFAGSNAETGTITNAHSFGDVTGKRTVGGFVGQNNGLIVGSTVADGVKVTGTQTWYREEVFGAPGTFIISDLKGIGGFAGTTGNTSRIVDSYAGAEVNGQGAVGAFIGNGFGGTVTNSYWNVDKNPGMGALGQRLMDDGTFYAPFETINGGAGLTNQQSADLQYYLNGTINQVLAARAARQESIRSANQAANVISNDAQVSSTTSPDPRMSRAGAAATRTAKSSAIDSFFTSVEDAAKVDDARQTRQRRASAAKGNQKNGSGGGFSPTIRSIDVDGQRFDLQNTPSQNNTPAPNAQ